MRALIPAGATADSVADLACRSCPALVTSDCGDFFLIIRGRGEVSLDGIVCVAVVRCMGRGGTTASGAADTRTRVRAEGRRFSFPLTLLLIANFLCATGCEEASPGVLFSVLEKPVRAVDSRRRVGCRAGGGGQRMPVLWCCAKDSALVRPSWPLQRSGLVSTDAGGVG